MCKNTLSVLVVMMGLSSLICMGCGDEGSRNGSAGGASSAAQLCSALCTKENECSEATDLQICNNQCEGELAEAASKLRADHVSHFTSCFAAEDCETVLAGEAGAACAAESDALLSPTTLGLSFCNAWEAASTKCDVLLDKAACYDLTRTINDTTLAEAQSCFDKSCADMSPCLSAAL